MSDELYGDIGSTAVGAGYGTTESISPAAADARVEEQKDIIDEHPELLAAGAFAGGFLLAQALRWIGGD